MLRNSLRAVMLATSIVVTVPTCNAMATPLAISGKDDVNDVINHFREAIAAVIAAVGAEARLTLGLAFQQANILIDNLSISYNKSLKLTFDQLDTQQQKLFQDANSAISQLTDDLDKNVGDITTEVNRFSRRIALVQSCA
jgi:hypothetical protein